MKKRLLIKILNNFRAWYTYKSLKKSVRDWDITLYNLSKEINSISSYDKYEKTKRNYPFTRKKLKEILNQYPF